MKNRFKKTYKGIVCVLLVLGLISCDEDDFVYTEPQGLIIQGQTKIEAGSTNKYSTYYLENGDYVWSGPSDAVITDGQGTSQVSVTFGTESGYIKVSAKGGRTVSLVVTVN